MLPSTLIYGKLIFSDLKKKLTISYPCVMLNVDVARNNTNDQYQVSLEHFSKLFIFIALGTTLAKCIVYCNVVCFIYTTLPVLPNSQHHFYQTLTDPIGNTYTTHSECSIEFEVDGPYKVTQ